MFESIVPFLFKYKFIFLFYLAVVVFLVTKRKRLEFQAKILILYRSKFGLKFIEDFSRKHGELIKLIGYIGVGAGYIGLFFISYLLLKNLYDLLTKPAAVSGVSLVLPGLNVPGLGVLPFWYWILALFLIALTHEFAHGIVARVHQVPLKNTGIVFLGPIIGAFVEPNERNLRKQKDIIQYSVLAAGSFVNILLALLALLLLNYGLVPLQEEMVKPTGFSFGEYYGVDYPAAQNELPVGGLITGINGEQTLDFMKFSQKLACLSPGDEVRLSTAGKEYSLTLAADPGQPEKPFLGVKNIKNEFKVKAKYEQGLGNIVYRLTNWLAGFLRWLFILSLGIGLFNLLPLPLVDGGRMLQVYLHQMEGKEKGEKRYRQITLFFLLVLLLNLFYPLIKGWLGS